MALFSKQNKEVFTNPLNLDHPLASARRWL